MNVVTSGRRDFGLVVAIPKSSCESKRDPPALFIEQDSTTHANYGGGQDRPRRGMQFGLYSVHKTSSSGNAVC
jgi:hypothetical protein